MHESIKHKGIVTFLFTDIDHSARSFQILSDDEAATLWRVHSEIVRSSVSDLREQEVKNIGDGYMVVFPNALAALACSLAIQQSARRHNDRQGEQDRLGVRVGLHAGEPARLKDAFLGKAALISKRLCECAQGGQIVASALVRRLVGSRGGYTFRDLQPLVLKGMAQPFPACEVIWSAEVMASHHLTGAREALLHGDVKEASLRADSALKASAEARSPFLKAMSHLAKTHVMLEQGKHPEASKHLKQALENAGNSGNSEAEFNALWTKAQFALQMGDEISGLASLQKALAIARERGYSNPFLEKSGVAAKLCIHALEAGIEVEFVKNIIKRRNLVPEKPPIHLEDWPWPVKIYTLGRFALMKDGKPVTFSRKAQHKPLSLLKTLIAFGTRDTGASDAQIADALWPDADGDVAHQTLATTLHRLRKLIGSHDAVQVQEGRLMIDPRYCWADVWAFESLLAQTEAAWKSAPKESAERTVRMMEAAVALYRGSFLAGETEEQWMLSPRERMKSKFLQAVMKLAHYWEKTQKWERAAECYQHGLDVDDLIEEFYRRLMICYQQIGLRTEALTVYDRCRKIFSSSLGVEPSPDTETVRISLLSEKKSQKPS